MSENTLIKKTEQFATNILKNELSKDLVLHNYEHSRAVVEAVETIGTIEKLNEEEMEIVLVAAWLHDVGYKSAYDRHEEKSKLIAQEFLEKENVSADKIEKILACILVTKPGAIPTNNVENVLLDAGKLDIKNNDFKTHIDNLSKELSAIRKTEISDVENLKNYLESISKYKFYTVYGKEMLLPAKDKLRGKLEKRLNKLQKVVDESLISKLGVTAAQLKAMKKKLQKAEGRPERGIETMFRLTSKNHIDLSGMADSKANIMISVNSIIISILLGSLMQKLDSNPHLVIPTIILLIVNLGSMIFSILSLRPNVSDGLFTREDIKNQKTNLLFFGNFHKMKREDYHWGMNKLMENANFLYSNLIDDIYFLGVVLAKKYSYLRISYNVFMYGVVVAVIAFIISIFFAEVPVSDSGLNFLPDKNK